jgi:haloalkane dehalogenase
MLGYDLDPGARANPTYVARRKEPAMPLSAKPYAAKKFAEVNGRRMACIDAGAGDAIVFQHGNPTSSYLWRNVMPHCAGLGRLVACDLIGMGDSDKLAPSGPDRYGYAEQRAYLFALWDQLDLGSKIVLVLHDWGSALGFEWARRNPERVAGLVYMEALVTPVTWADWPENARRAFQGFRSPAGEDMILEKNMFVERVLPGSFLR